MRFLDSDILGFQFGGIWGASLTCGCQRASETIHNALLYDLLKRQSFFLVAAMITLKTLP
jgi:hypothetical protein